MLAIVHVCGEDDAMRLRSLTLEVLRSFLIKWLFVASAYPPSDSMSFLSEQLDDLGSAMFRCSIAPVLFDACRSHPGLGRRGGGAFILAVAFTPAMEAIERDMLLLEFLFYTPFPSPPLSTRLH
ncbi:hypothetical protein MRX96_004785 [Rhipicephalus microplus]